MSSDHNKITNQKGEHLVIDLGSIDTQSLLNEGDNKITYTNELSSWEMDSLTALCDTIIPAVDPPESATEDSVIRFYKTSASMAKTPDHVCRHHLFPFFFLIFSSTKSSSQTLVHVSMSDMGTRVQVMLSSLLYI